MTRKSFDIGGMSCAACSARVQNAVEKLNGVKVCSVNLLKNTMDVTFAESVINETDIINAVKKAGYFASLRDKSATSLSAEKQKKNANKILNRLLISIVLLCVLMVISMGHMVGINIFNEHQMVLKGIVELIISIPII